MESAYRGRSYPPAARAFQPRTFRPAPSLATLAQVSAALEASTARPTAATSATASLSYSDSGNQPSPSGVVLFRLGPPPCPPERSSWGWGGLFSGRELRRRAD